MWSSRCRPSSPACKPPPASSSLPSWCPLAPRLRSLRLSRSHVLTLCFLVTLCSLQVVAEPAPAPAAAKAPGAFCPNCGAPIPPGARCVRAGAPRV
jgi:hypothetical protein